MGQPQPRVGDFMFTVEHGRLAVILSLNGPHAVSTERFKLHGQPAYLIGGNFSVRVKREGRDWFVWKKEKLEVTAARLTELENFTAQLSQALMPLT